MSLWGSYTFDTAFGDLTQLRPLSHSGYVTVDDEVVGPKCLEQEIFPDSLGILREGLLGQSL